MSASGEMLIKKKAVIYARFSTDLQNERSVEDQVALCRTYAAQHDLDVIRVYDDRARSGASLLGRDGLLDLLNGARARNFGVVIVEALDRLSRDMEDLAGLHKRLTFLDIEIRAVHEGVVNTVLVGLRGLVGQLYREDNAHKIRRGMAGRIGNGLSPGGITYGYEPVPGEIGKRRIVEAEATVVRRIFDEFVSGRSPRAIAYDLNRDHIAPPRGRVWNASAINGNVQRKAGILHNELYIGRLVWNKLRMVKDPDTGRRVSRPNPESEWQVAEVPELAIIPREQFDAAQGRKKQRAKVPLQHRRRPKHILSGLLRCGACGAGMSTNGKDKSGRIRIRCSAAAESGTCPDPRTFYLDTVEGAVLSGLGSELRQPQVIAEYVRTYHAERERLMAEATAKRTRLEQRLVKIDRDVNHMIDLLLEEPRPNPVPIKLRMNELSVERQAVVVELETIPPEHNVVSLHPHVLKRYEEQVANLQTAIANGLAAGDSDAADALRDLIDTITVFRGADGPGKVEIEISGKLTALLGENAYPHGVRGVWGLMVAGEGFEPPTLGL